MVGNSESIAVEQVKEIFQEMFQAHEKVLWTS